MNDWLPILKMFVPFLVLFGLAEGLYHLRKVSAEVTRKIVHVGTGLLTLLFPFSFNHLWQVVFICGVFLVLLLCSKQYRFLPSINAVARSTRGSELFPVVVILVFAFYQWMQGNPTTFDALLFFWLPLLVMAIADPVAAFAGNFYKMKKGVATGKTTVGSFAFLLTSFLIATTTLYCMTPLLVSKVLANALLIAFASTIAERFSSKGWDNFTIPLTAAGLLYLIA